MELSYSTDEHQGVTLVEFELYNPTRTPREVTVASELDGPVLPPRRGGYPVEGWDDTGFVGPIHAGARRAFGFACPAPAVDPPVTVVAADPVDDVRTDRSAADLVRTLGDPRPPAAAVDPTASGSVEASADETTGDVAETAAGVPPAIAAWFDAVETRLEAGEHVDGDRVCAVADRATELHRRCRR
ncbi:MAG: hypothetical protein ABEJ57_01030 [Halobacteriaceae archaeon]